MRAGWRPLSQLRVRWRRACEDSAAALRLAFFSVEEWALTGSAQYVQGLTAAERNASPSTSISNR